MKHIKLIYILMVTLVFYSCVVEDGENPFYPPKAFGLAPNYEAGSNSVYNLLDPTNSFVDFIINASASGNAVAISGAVYANVNSGEYSKIEDIGSFPYNVNISLSSVLSSMGLSSSDVTGGDIINFKTFFTDTNDTTTTSTSVFSCAIVCPPIAGTYIIEMQDAWGDGWQGGGINFILDGEITFITLADPNASSGRATFEVPSGATALVLEYVDDLYNEEVSFQIYDPNGVKINDSSNPSAGVLSVPSTCP